jgi:hypothetical protein
MIINIDKQDYKVNENEFQKIPHKTYNNLLIRDNVGSFERIISLLVKLSKTLNIIYILLKKVYQKLHIKFGYTF